MSLLKCSQCRLAAVDGEFCLQPEPFELACLQTVTWKQVSACKSGALFLSHAGSLFFLRASNSSWTALHIAQEILGSTELAARIVSVGSSHVSDELCYVMDKDSMIGYCADVTVVKATVKGPGSVFSIAPVSTSSALMLNGCLLLIPAHRRFYLLSSRGCSAVEASFISSAASWKPRCMIAHEDIFAFIDSEGSMFASRISSATKTCSSIRISPHERKCLTAEIVGSTMLLFCDDGTVMAIDDVASQIQASFLSQTSLDGGHGSAAETADTWTYYQSPLAPDNRRVENIDTYVVMSDELLEGSSISVIGRDSSRLMIRADTGLLCLDMSCGIRSSILFSLLSTIERQQLACVMNCLFLAKDRCVLSLKDASQLSSSITDFGEYLVRYVASLDKLQAKLKNRIDMEAKRIEHAAALVAKLRTKELKFEASEEQVVMSLEERAVRLIQKWHRRRVLANRWRSVVKQFASSSMAKEIRTRNRIVYEVITTEREYVRTLQEMCSQFIVPLRKAVNSASPVLSSGEISSLFQNAELICSVHQLLLNELEQCAKEWPLMYIAPSFKRQLPFFSIYSLYLSGYDGAISMYYDLRKKNKNFEAFLRSRSHVELTSLMVTPFQRLPRYVMLFRTLLENTPVTHVEYEDAVEFLQSMEALLQDINAEKHRKQSSERVSQLAPRITSSEPGLLSFDPATGSEPLLVREGPLQWFDTSANAWTEAHVFLFAHMLLVTKATSAMFDKIGRYSELAVLQFALNSTGSFSVTVERGQSAGAAIGCDAAFWEIRDAQSKLIKLSTGSEDGMKQWMDEIQSHLFKRKILLFEKRVLSEDADSNKRGSTKLSPGEHGNGPDSPSSEGSKASGMDLLYGSRKRSQSIYGHRT